MKAYFFNLWDSARTSFWFVPSLFVVSAITLALLMPLVDSTVAEAGWDLPEWIHTETDTARSTLSSLLGAMVAVTGTVFSITVVSLSLASQQFGPRLLRRFMYDLPTQVTLGVFLATAFYCLLLLRVVESRRDGVTVPHLSVLVAVIFAVMSMMTLIVFIHHVSTLIQAPHIVAAVAVDLDDAIDRLFPERIGGVASDRDATNVSGRAQADALGDDYVTIPATKAGYILARGGEGISDLSREEHLVVRLELRPGHFMSPDVPLAHVWTARSESGDELDHDEITERLNDKVIVGVRRTPRQDVECAISELVEVAVRSLSAGINDPFTAINCVDRLGASLARLAEREMVSPYRLDDEGRLRVVATTATFGSLLDASFNMIRQYGRDSVAVTIRMLETLASVALRVHRDDDRLALARHAEMVARNAESYPEENDRRHVRDRLERFYAANQPASHDDPALPT
ncbi:MAG: DUF2254 domain-containing protein [Pirellulales bacterium]